MLLRAYVLFCLAWVLGRGADLWGACICFGVFVCVFGLWVSFLCVCFWLFAFLLLGFSCFWLFLAFLFLGSGSVFRIFVLCCVFCFSVLGCAFFVEDVEPLSVSCKPTRSARESAGWLFSRAAALTHRRRQLRKWTGVRIGLLSF